MVTVSSAQGVTMPSPSVSRDGLAEGSRNRSALPYFGRMRRHARPGGPVKINSLDALRDRDWRRHDRLPHLQPASEQHQGRRVGHPRHQCGKDRAAGNPAKVGDHTGQFDLGVFEELLQPLHLAGAVPRNTSACPPAVARPTSLTMALSFPRRAAVGVRS